MIRSVRVRARPVDRGAIGGGGRPSARCRRLGIGRVHRCTTDVSFSSSATSATVLRGERPAGASRSARVSTREVQRPRASCVSGVPSPSPRIRSGDGDGATAAAAGGEGGGEETLCSRGGVTVGRRAGRCRCCYPRVATEGGAVFKQIQRWPMKQEVRAVKGRTGPPMLSPAVEAAGDWALTHEEMRELGQAPFGTHPAMAEPSPRNHKPPATKYESHAPPLHNNTVVHTDREIRVLVNHHIHRLDYV